ncbi:MAG: hypothetical protein ACC646_08935 [Paracoccaceae bacterium]
MFDPADRDIALARSKKDEDMNIRKTLLATSAIVMLSAGASMATDISHVIFQNLTDQNYTSIVITVGPNYVEVVAFLNGAKIEQHYDMDGNLRKDERVTDGVETETIYDAVGNVVSVSIDDDEGEDDELEGEDDDLEDESDDIDDDGDDDDDDDDGDDDDGDDDNDDDDDDDDGDDDEDDDGAVVQKALPSALLLGKNE